MLQYLNGTTGEAGSQSGISIEMLKWISKKYHIQLSIIEDDISYNKFGIISYWISDVSQANIKHLNRFVLSFLIQSFLIFK